MPKIMHPEDPSQEPQPKEPQPENQPQAAQQNALWAESQPEKNPFPPEHAHLHDWVMEAEVRLQQLEQEMNRPRQGPRPSFDPPGYSSLAIRPVSRSQNDIQQEKDMLKAKVYRQVEKETEQAPTKTQQASRDTAFGRLYQEDIAKLAAAPRNQLPQPAAHWNINDVQVKIMAQAKNARDQQRETKQPVPSEPAGQTMPKPEWAAVERPVALPVSDATCTLENEAPAQPSMEPER